MHGELLIPDPEATGEARVPGNATFEDDTTVRWEFHDRDLPEGRVSELIAALERIRAAGRRVRLSYIAASPPLAEVESGPEADDLHTEPVRYEILEVDEEHSRVRLRLAGDEG